MRYDDELVRCDTPASVRVRPMPPFGDRKHDRNSLSHETNFKSPQRVNGVGWHAGGRPGMVIAEVPQSRSGALQVQNSPQKASREEKASSRPLRRQKWHRPERHGLSPAAFRPVCRLWAAFTPDRGRGGRRSKSSAILCIVFCPRRFGPIRRRNRQYPPHRTLTPPVRFMPMQRSPPTSNNKTTSEP